MDLLSVVVVPAHDEERTIASCLEALAEQTVPRDAFETIVVADACTDETVAVARRTADRLGLALTILTGPGAGTGPARRLGMDAAATRLGALGRDDGLIATTDADSQPAPDWLARQLSHVARGAEVIAGLIELDRRRSLAAPERRAATPRGRRGAPDDAGRSYRSGRGSSPLRRCVAGGDRQNVRGRWRP